MSFKKIIFFVSFLAIFGFLFNLNAPIAKAMTAAEIQSLIQQLQTQIASLQQQLAQIQGTTVTVWCHTFNVNLKYGDAGKEIEALQIALEKEGLYTKGTNPPHFDESLASAVVGFQEKYSAEVLAPLCLKHGTGFVGPSTRAKLNKIYGCAVVPPLTTPSITVISPNGGERWEVGKTYSVKWKISNVPTSAYVFVQLVEDTPFSPPSHIFTTVPSTQDSVDFTIPVGTKTGNYKAMVQVCVIIDGTTTVCSDGRNPWHNVVDKSDAPFSIVAATSPACTDSDGGKSYYTKGTIIRSDGYLSTDRCIDPRYNQGYDLIEEFCLSDGKSSTEAYTCPHGCRDGACIKKPAPSITVISPNGGERWTVRTAYFIKWIAENATRVSIDIIDETGKVPSWDSGIPAVLRNSKFGFEMSYLWAIPNTALPGKYKVKIGACPVQISDLDCANEDLSKYAVDLSDNYFSIIASTTTIEPSITISSNPSAYAGKVTINKGGRIIITGKPVNLSGTMLNDYTRAFFFDPIFYGSCTNTDWEITCLANKEGVGRFYIEIYKAGKTYRSNIIEATVISGLGLKDLENQLVSISAAISQLAERIKELLRR